VVEIQLEANMRLIDQQIMQQLFEQAGVSERKRSHYLLHESHGDKVQRLIIAMLRGSYVEPHFHELSHQWEMFIVSMGSIRVTIYNTNGTSKHSFEAGPQHEVSLVEFSSGDIHSVECLSERAVMIEIKEGPFDANYAKAFPQW
jgi:cupin fold WbuC family metalloprotein